MPVKIEKRCILPSLCGFFVALLGITVLFGWYTHNLAFIQVHPSFAPMQYNTALAFLLTGFGLSAITFNRPTVAAGCGILTSLTGFLTLAQYILNTNFGIDQMFMEYDVMTKVSHPGRMAPNTALCFSLCGLSLIFGYKKRVLMTNLGFAVLALSVLAFIGYVIAEESIYGWGSLTRMAIHTAFGFLVLSVGFILSGLRKQDGNERYNLWDIAPTTLPMVVFILTLFSAYILANATQARNVEFFQKLVTQTQDGILERYALYEQSLFGGLGMFYASKSVERDEWKVYAEALNVKTRLPGINGVGYIDYVLEPNLEAYLQKTREDNAPDFTNHPETSHPDKFIIKYIEPVQQNAAAVGLDIGFESNRRAAAEHARDFGVPALTKKIELVQDDKKQPGFLLLIPVYDIKKLPDTVQERKKHLIGWVYAPFIGSSFLTGLSKINNDQLDFYVYDGEEVAEEHLIYSQNGRSLPSAANNRYAAQTQINIAARTWTLEWRPTDQFSPPGHHDLTSLILAFGLALTVFLYFALRYLVHSKDIIAREVDRQTLQLQKAFNELAQANKELEKFAYIASHDLKAPLRAIDNTSQWIAEDLEDVMEDETRKRMDLMRSRVKRLEAMLQDILEYSRVGRIVEEPKDISLNDLLSEIIEGLDIPKTFEVNTPTDMPKIFSPRTPLEQIFMNLITNAVKHHDKTTGTIDITWKDKESVIELSVQDDGPGIPEEFQDRVFEMFQMLKSRDETEGTGLGMSIIKKLVEWQNGSIWIESKDGERGTTVKFTWPKKVSLS